MIPIIEAVVRVLGQKIDISRQFAEAQIQLKNSRNEMERQTGEAKIFQKNKESEQIDLIISKLPDIRKNLQDMNNLSELRATEIYDALDNIYTLIEEGKNRKNSPLKNPAIIKEVSNTIKEYVEGKKTDVKPLLNSIAKLTAEIVRVEKLSVDMDKTTFEYSERNLERLEKKIDQIPPSIEKTIVQEIVIKENKKGDLEREEISKVVNIRLDEVEKKMKNPIRQIFYGGGGNNNDSGGVTFAKNCQLFIDTNDYENYFVCDSTKGGWFARRQLDGEIKKGGDRPTTLAEVKVLYNEV